MQEYEKTIADMIGNYIFLLVNNATLSAAHNYWPKN